MRRGRLWIGSFLLPFLLLTACNRPSALPEVAGAGPHAWIDAPLNQSSLPFGPIALVAHGTDLGGLSSFELAVNGQTIQQAPPEDANASLVEWEQAWDPPAPGNYTLHVRVQNHAGVWSAPAEAIVTILGESSPTVANDATATPASTTTPAPTSTSTATPVCTDLARFFRETITDNTVFAPGAAFTKTWRLRNEGTCTWGPDYRLVFISGERMGGASPQPLAGNVAPGQETDVSVQLTGPGSDGTYRGNWMLRNGQGQAFGLGDTGGTAFWVQIIIASTRADTQAPRVVLTHDPSGSLLAVGTRIAFSAIADDNVGVANIEIWIAPPGQASQRVQTCPNTTTCSYRAAFDAAGDLTYEARAFDAAGNQGSDSGSITLMVMR